MKILLLLASLVSILSLATAYTSYLSVNGRELINSGSRGGAKQSNSISVPANSFLPKGKPKASISLKPFKASSSASFLSQQSETPQLAPAPTVQEAPQLFAILVPAEEQQQQQQQVSHSSSLRSAVQSESLQGSKAYEAAPGSTVTAAVHTRHSLQLVDVPVSHEKAQSPEIIIPANAQPIDIAFHSQSSPITVRQVHIPGQAAAPQESAHEEEPDLLKQTIIKPIIHEVKETIAPIRKVTQEVRPVEETVNQLIARSSGQTKFNMVAKAMPRPAAATGQTFTLQPIGAVNKQLKGTPILLAIQTKDNANVIKK